MIAIDALLVAAVLFTWIGCLGFARLRSPLDRMHCVAFVYATAGSCFVAAAFVSDGASSRSLKALMVVGIGLISGAALSHATGRSLLLRGSTPTIDAQIAQEME